MFNLPPKAYILVHQDHKVPGSDAQLLVLLDERKEASMVPSSHGATLQAPKLACVT